MRRTLIALFTLLVLTLLSILPAGAADRPTLVRTVSFTADQLGGFSAGDIEEYSDGSILVKMRLRGDLGENEDGTENDAKAKEWEFNLYADSTCGGGSTLAHDSSQIGHFHYENPVDKYGPRILQRSLTGPTIDKIGSVELVHDGPLSDHGQTTKGRHHIACVTL